MVEDELATIEVCKTYISRLIPDIEWVGEAYNLKEAEEHLNNITPDILLLDISLPDGNSFELLGKVNTSDLEIIFITAYEEYALKAIKVNAADYLLKPIIISELQQAIQNSINNIQEKKANQILKLSVSSTEGVEFINKNDIVYIKAGGNYSEIFTIDNRKILATKVLKQIEIQVGNHFLRTHKSYIVNLNLVNKYNKSKQTLQLNQNVEIPISKSRKEEVLKALYK